MDPKQIRARLAAIKEQLDGIVAVDGAYTQEQLDTITKLNEEFEGLSTQLDAAEKVEAMKAKASASTGRKTQTDNPSAVVQITRHENERFGGFKSSGAFLTAVRDAAKGRVADQFKSAAYEKNGEDGGFLVPEDIATEIVTKLNSSDDSLWAKATTYPVGGNSLSFPVDEAQPWNSGVQAYWVDEGDTIPGTKPKFRDVDFKLKKLGALVVCTDELLADAVALEGYIKRSAPAAINNKVNGAIISGDGIGKPNGIIGSGFTYQVAKESGQSADTIVAKNIINMYSRMIPTARAGAVWLINAGCEPQLLQMKDDLGNFIYLAAGSQMNNSPYALLMGRPVIPMMASMPALGDAGDILFANMSYYHGISKGGVKSAESIHAYFDTEKTAYRFTMRLDGRVPFKAPVTTEFGSYDMSAFIKLEAR